MRNACIAIDSISKWYLTIICFFHQVLTEAADRPSVAMKYIPDYLLPPSIVPKSAEEDEEADGGRRGGKRRGRRNDEGEEGETKKRKHFKPRGKKANDPLRSFQMPDKRRAASSEA